MKQETMKTFKTLSTLSFLLFIFILLAGCKSKKVTTDISTDISTDTKKEVKIVYDTVWKEKIVIKTLPIYSETIFNPCDSLGNLRPINTTIGSGQNKSSISSFNGQLIIRQYIDSTFQQNELIKQLRTELDSIIYAKESVKENTLSVKEKVFVWPWWIYALIVGCILFAGLWVYTKFFTPF